MGYRTNIHPQIVLHPSFGTYKRPPSLPRVHCPEKIVFMMSGYITSTTSSVKLWLRLCRNIADDVSPEGTEEERVKAVKDNWKWIIKATNYSGTPMFQANPTDLNFLTNLLQSLTADDVFNNPKFQYIRSQILFAIFIPRPVHIRSVSDFEAFPVPLERQSRFMGEEGTKIFKHSDK